MPAGAWGIPSAPAALQRSDARVVRELRTVREPERARVDTASSGTGAPRLWRLAAHTAAVFVTVLAVGLSALAQAPRVLGYRPVVVSSGSMEPMLQVGDVVVTNPGGKIGVQSVIDFRVGDGTRIHRVIELLEDGYRTKGDANPTPDSTIVAPEDVRGTGALVVPLVGMPQRWAAAGRWAPLAASAVALGIAFRLSTRRWLFADPKRTHRLLHRRPR